MKAGTLLGSEKDERDLAAAIRSLEPREVRATMSARGREVVDGRGADRAASAIARVIQEGK